jgi:general nucleoside transport system permease protein
VNDSTVVTLIVSGILFGTPLALAAIGEILAERSGVLNLGIEGMMLVGAVAAFWTSVQTGSVWLAILVAIGAGAVMSAVVALMSITLRVSQIVTGLGVVLFGIGLSSFIGRTGDPPLHGQSASATITPFLDSGPADWPVVGPILLGHDFVVYVTWIFAAVASWYLFKTRTGLATRAVGEDPASADAAGVRVAAVRYAHVLIGGAAAGFGGAYFTLALIPSWQDEITAGAGWIAIAIVIIARWRPWRALLAAYVFGAATRLGLTLQILNVSISPQLLSMIPFLLAIAAVLLSSIARSRGGSAPASLARPYFREER